MSPRAMAAGAKQPDPQAAAAATTCSNEDLMNPENENCVRSVAYCNHRLAEIKQDMEKRIAEGRRMDKGMREANKTLTMVKM